MKIKQPTKQQFKDLLQNEIQVWTMRTESLEGNMLEQAIGRIEELKWLLEIHEGKIEIPCFEVGNSGQTGEEIPDSVEGGTNNGPEETKL